MKDKYYKKAFELIKKDISKRGCLFLSVQSDLEDYLNEAKERLDVPVLTKNQIGHLKEDIKYLELATKHKYHSIMYGNVGVFPKVTFAYRSERFNEDRFDSIGGSPCYTQKLETNKVYYLEELLNE